VVQATNPQGRVIQVSILTDDKKADAALIARWMFNRWLQENDFKYLDKHFGINQITSYGVTGYEELRQKVADRQVRSAEIKALGEQKRQLRAQQSRLLLLQAKGEHQATPRQQRMDEFPSVVLKEQNVVRGDGAVDEAACVKAEDGAEQAFHEAGKAVGVQRSGFLV